MGLKNNMKRSKFIMICKQAQAIWSCLIENVRVCAKFCGTLARDCRYSAMTLPKVTDFVPQPGFAVARVQHRSLPPLGGSLFGSSLRQVMNSINLNANTMDGN